MLRVFWSNGAATPRYLGVTDFKSGIQEPQTFIVHVVDCLDYIESGELLSKHQFCDGECNYRGEKGVDYKKTPQTEDKTREKMEFILITFKSALEPPRANSCHRGTIICGFLY